jgi:hypothetical protein
MAIMEMYAIVKLSDSDIEPISLTDMKNWMRVRDNADDSLISSLITSARKNIENRISGAITNQRYKSVFELFGENRDRWIVSLPYGSIDCDPVVKMKNGINDYTILVKNTDYEVIGNKLWLYNMGVYDVEYDCGMAQVPDDLLNDIYTLVTWFYDNRGKKMNADPKGNRLAEYPNWEGLNYHRYNRVPI